MRFVKVDAIEPGKPHGSVTDLLDAFGRISLVRNSWAEETGWHNASPSAFVGVTGQRRCSGRPLSKVQRNR